MRSFKNFRGIVENAPIQAVENQQEKEIAAKINAIVDSWTQELINLLLKSGSGSSSGAKRGLWDRFKGTVSNLWHGRDGESNPYKWINKFGDDLGQRESFSLEQYKNLKETCDILEHQINEDVENLRIFQLIKSAAAKLKQDLHTAILSSPPEVNTPSNATVAPAENPRQISPVAAEPLRKSSKSAATAPESDIEPEIYHRSKHFPPDAVSPKAVAKAPESDIEPEIYQQSKHLPPASISSPKKSEEPQKSIEKEIEKKEEPLQAQQQKTGDFYTNPPTSGLTWENLNTSQIEKWNKYGGGIANNIGGDCLKFTKGTPITRLPYILRIGDPRIDVVKSQKLDGANSFNQKYLDKERLAGNSKLASFKDFDPEKHCTKKNARVWESLIRNKRVEGEEGFGEPIRSEEDLRSRIEVIKQNMAKEPKDSSANNNFNPPESINPAEPTIAPSVTATKEDRKSNQKEAPKVSASDPVVPKRGRGRPKKNVEVPSWLKDSQQNAKEMPAPEEPHVPHISPVPEEAPEAPKEIKAQVKETEPEKDIESLRREAEEEMKGGSPAIFEKYFDKVQEAQSTEKLEKLIKAIKHMKNMESDENDLEELPEWNLKDTRNFLRKKYLK
jgi:hypothetical protein